MSAIGRLLEDERAVEGLPIRLVVGVVVGVASLSVMLSMVSGVGSLAVTELDAVPEPAVVAPGDRSITITAVDPDGDPVADATVIVKGDTAELGRVRTATTGENGTATIEISPGLAPNQADGRLAISLEPPPGGSYVDRRENAAILVVEGA